MSFTNIDALPLGTLLQPSQGTSKKPKKQKSKLKQLQEQGYGK